MDIVINTTTGKTGDFAAWVAVFNKLWLAGSESIEDFMDLLSPEVRLIAPGLRSTKGRDAGQLAFRKTFAVLPDLTGEVLRWSAKNDVLFIEMSFRAKIGGRFIQWDNVDRFLFEDGYAVERVAYFDQTKVRRAFLSNPKGWAQLYKRIRSGL